MINKVFLEGVVTRSAWGKNKEEGGYFLNIKQERVFNKFKSVNSFSAYANRPLAGQLAKIVEANPGCTVYIEGKLRTYFSKKDSQYHTTILIEKLSNWTPAEKTTVVAEENIKA